MKNLSAILTIGCTLALPAMLAAQELKAPAPKPAEAEAIQIDGAELGKWTMDYDAAMDLAKEKSLPALLNFTGSDWCTPCMIIDQRVFATKVWKDYAAKNTLLVTIDFPNNKKLVPQKYVARNEKLEQQFGVQGYPTFIIVDSDGKTVLGQIGASLEPTPKSFIQDFEGVTRLRKASVDAFAKANPDKADAYKAAVADYRKIKQELTDWIATGPLRTAENNKKYTQFIERLQKADTTLSAFHKS